MTDESLSGWRLFKLLALETDTSLIKSLFRLASHPLLRLDGRHATIVLSQQQQQRIAQKYSEMARQSKTKPPDLRLTLGSLPRLRNAARRQMEVGMTEGAASNDAIFLSCVGLYNKNASLHHQCRPFHGDLQCCGPSRN
jgi:hypothetical protein